VKNATITLSIAAALGALSAGAVASGSAPLAVVVGAAAIVATEGLRKSRAFVALAALVSQGIDKASEGEIMKALADFREGFKPQLRFFLSIEANIKRLAGQRQEFKWLTKTLPWLEQQTGGKQRNDQHQPEPTPASTGDPEEQVLHQDVPQQKGNMYLSKVMRVEPSLQAAFVDYGGHRLGLLPFSEIHPDYYQIPVADRRALIDDESRTRRIAEEAREANATVNESTRDAITIHEGEGLIASSSASGALDEGANQEPRHRHQYKIQDVIKRRQVMLVQVVKDADNAIAALLTTRLSLAGRYLLLMPNTSIVNISHEIANAADRIRLKDLIKQLEIPDGMGVILRDAGTSRTKAEIERDFEYLLRTWEEVRDFTLKSTAPTLVYEAERSA
jgi:hypothetical protein